MPRGIYPRKTLEERFWEKVDVRGPDECWPWTSAINPNGYGVIWYQGRNHGAHRISLRIAGQDPGENTRHCCVANPLCVNPNHLLPGTSADNNRDTVRQGRARVGEQHHRCKLSGTAVAAIRVSYEVGATTLSDLAWIHGVSVSQIHRIVKGQSRNHD